MRRVNFTKMVASGNDFVVADHRLVEYAGRRLKELARSICDRKFGVGADGLLVIERSRRADAKMRIFNADGSEAEMCGNGARCVSLFVGGKRQLKLETMAGIIQARLSQDNIRIRLTDPKAIKLDLPIRISPRTMRVNFINTGVPHAVVFTEGLDKIDIKSIGRQIRYHKKFMPQGANADFVEVQGRDLIAIRTYERGVEDETLACGTGSVAAALIFSLKSAFCGAVKVRTRSGEVLKVYFDRQGHKISDVWLEGRAKKVYKGEYYV